MTTDSNASTIKLAVIPGDGIGQEVTAEALKVLEVASPAGCVCAAGFVRAAGEATCSEPPADAGGLCGSDAGCGG